VHDVVIGDGGADGGAEVWVEGPGVGEADVEVGALEAGWLVGSFR